MKKDAFKKMLELIIGMCVILFLGHLSNKQICGIEHVTWSVQNIRNIRFFLEHSQKKMDIMKCIFFNADNSDKKYCIISLKMQKNIYN